MTCQKYQHLWPTIRERLGTAPHLFFVGGATETRLDGDVLHLACNDGYDGLCEKVLKLLHWLHADPAAPSYTHILKIDDWDTHVTADSVSKLQYQDVDYGGQRTQHSPPSTVWHCKYIKDPTNYWYERPFTNYWFPYHHGGEGYILSRKAVAAICKEMPVHEIPAYYYKEIYEDMMVGRLLAQAGIHPITRPYGIKTGPTDAPKA